MIITLLLVQIRCYHKITNCFLLCLFELCYMYAYLQDRQNSSKVFALVLMIIINEVFNASKLPCSLFLPLRSLFRDSSLFHSVANKTKKKKKGEKQRFSLLYRKRRVHRQRRKKPFDHIYRIKRLYNAIKKKQKKKYCQ